jgi:hypothetical protein
MATRARRSLPAHTNSKTPTLKTRIAGAALSPAAKTVYVMIGTAGLAALAIAIFGPKRFQREILKPVRSAVGDQAGQLWSDSRPLREQIGNLFARAGSEAGRERLVRNFQSWIGHFRTS